MDPVSIIASTIAIIGAITTAYQVVKTISNLPSAFEEVNKQLPLVERTLRAADSRLREAPEPTEKDNAAIAEIVKTCQEKATKLREIFEELEKKRESDTGAVSWTKVRAAYCRVLAGVKAHRVETVMEDILKSTKRLALNQVFQAATKGDLKEIEKAIEELARVQPSLDDSDFDGAEGITASMTIASGGKGQQNNVQGDHSTFYSGEYVTAGSGHTIYFGKEPPRQ